MYNVNKCTNSAKVQPAPEKKIKEYVFEQIRKYKRSPAKYDPETN